MSERPIGLKEFLRIQTQIAALREQKSMLRIECTVGHFELAMQIDRLEKIASHVAVPTAD